MEDGLVPPKFMAATCLLPTESAGGEEVVNLQHFARYTAL